MDAKQTTDNVGYAISVFFLYLFDGLIAIDDAGLHQDGDDAVSFQTDFVHCDFCCLQGCSSPGLKVSPTAVLRRSSIWSVCSFSSDVNLKGVSFIVVPSC